MFGSSNFLGSLARQVLLQASIAVLLASQSPSAIAVAPETPQNPPRLNASNKARIENLLQSELQRVVNSQKRLPGQGRTILVRVQADVKTGIVVVNLEKTYIPKGKRHLTEDLSESLMEITGVATDLLNGIIGYKYVTVKIEGKDLSELFPDDYAPSKSGMLLPAVVNQGFVVVNPGHGKYFHYGSQAWEFQRPIYVGSADVREDTLMRSYSTELTSLPVNRSYEHVTVVAKTRDVLNSAIDPASGLQWQQLGSR